MKVAGSIKIDIPLTAKGWICKVKGHDWSPWKEINSQRMWHACLRCGIVEEDTPPERHSNEG